MLLAYPIVCELLISNPRKKLLWKEYKQKRTKHILSFLKKAAQTKIKKEKAKIYRETRKRKEQSDKHYLLKKRIKKFCEGAEQITVEDILNKFGPNPKCYLTGLPINYLDGNTYHFDHVIPKSKGGSNTLDNLQLSHPWANIAKNNYTIEEFVNLCRRVVVFHTRPL